MPGGISDYMGRARTNLQMRLDSVTKQLPEDFRKQGLVPAIVNLGTRFGRLNRELIGRV